MRSRNTRRGMAVAAVLVSGGLVLAGCGGSDSRRQSEASGTSPGEGKAECASSSTQFGDLERQVGEDLHLDRRPRGPAVQGLVQAVHGVHGRRGRLRGLEGVRGPARRPRQERQPAGHRVHPAARSAEDPGPGHRQGRARRRRRSSDNVDEYYGEDWKAYGTVDGKFYAPPLTANVKSFVWYSPKMFEENGWDDPDDLGRDARPLRQDRGHRHQAVVRRHRLRRRHRLAGDRLAGGRAPARRRPGRLRPVGQPRDPVQRPGRRQGARRRSAAS